MGIRIEEKNGGVVFGVRVIPRASKNAFAGEHDGAVKIRISAPPVDGAANNEVIAFLAKAFGIAKSSVTIENGLASRNKLIRIDGLNREEFLDRFNAILKS